MKTKEVSPNPNPSKQKSTNKRSDYLAYRFGVWYCNLCGGKNLNVETEVKTGYSKELVQICNCCGQTDEEDFTTYE